MENNGVPKSSWLLGILGSLIIGFSVNWYIHNKLIRESLTIYSLTNLSLLRVQGYFLSLVVLVFIWLLVSFVADIKWFDQITFGLDPFESKDTNKILTPLVYSFRILVFVFTTFFWAYYLQLTWLSKVNYFFEFSLLQRVLLLFIFLLIFLLLVFVIFEPQSTFIKNKLVTHAHSPIITVILALISSLVRMLICILILSVIYISSALSIKTVFSIILQQSFF